MRGNRPCETYAFASCVLHGGFRSAVCAVRFLRFKTAAHEKAMPSLAEVAGVRPQQPFFGTLSLATKILSSTADGSG
jgi:hypothetical protein